MSINCACFTPNTGRLEDIERLVKDYHANGVILYTLSFCTPYEMEAANFEKKLKDAGIPVLSITTDYSSEDQAQLQNRIEAFLEMIQLQNKFCSINRHSLVFLTFFNKLLKVIPNCFDQCIGKSLRIIHNFLIITFLILGFHKLPLKFQSFLNPKCHK